MSITWSKVNAHQRSLHQKELDIKCKPIGY